MAIFHTEDIMHARHFCIHFELQGKLLLSLQIHDSFVNPYMVILSGVKETLTQLNPYSCTTHTDPCI